MEKLNVLPAPDVNNGIAADPVAIAEGIEANQSEKIKKPRKPYTKRINKENAETPISEQGKATLQYVSSIACGKILNSPFRIAGLFVRNGDLLPFDEAIEKELGDNASVVLQSFFPITKENEKYYALFTLIGLYTTITVEQITKWTLSNKKNSNSEK
jgi:hypothetical protein